MIGISSPGSSCTPSSHFPNLKFCTAVASIVVAVSKAKTPPMHDRGPAPNGVYTPHPSLEQRVQKLGMHITRQHLQELEGIASLPLCPLPHHTDAPRQAPKHSAAAMKSKREPSSAHAHAQARARSPTSGEQRDTKKTPHAPGRRGRAQ